MTHVIQSGSRLEYGEAYLSYTRTVDALTVEHTVVPRELAGQGIGGKLVQGAVDLARREGLAVVPTCPFARRWLERHPDA